MNSLQLIDKKHKKNIQIDTAALKRKNSNMYSNPLSMASIRTRSLMIYGAPDDDMYYPGSENQQAEAVSLNNDLNDDLKRDFISDIFSNSISQNQVSQMAKRIDEVINSITDGNLFSTVQTLNANRPDAQPSGSSISIQNGTGDTPVGGSTPAAAWDPRLMRVDAWVTAGNASSPNAIVPFSTASASSAYYDLVFNIEVAALEEGAKDKPITSTTSGQSTQDAIKSTNTSGEDKTSPSRDVKELKNMADEHGVQSLMNPYCVTTLVGGLATGGAGGAKFSSRLYDIRDLKRFYDSTGSDNTGNMVDDPNDILSINNPTTTNIIRWSNRDKWGRTPYSFQDFVFCKYWNIIPNNRMITFRKYATPTFDNLNFHGMLKDGGAVDNSKATAPIATVVTYFGGESSNKISDIMKFSTGTKWKDITADIHKVTGDTGSNPRAVIDSMFEKGGGFGGLGSGSTIVNAFLGQAGGLTGQYLSFGKFLGLLAPDGYRGHSQAAWENMTKANVDPQESIYSNRIIGPVNRVQSVKARDAGIEFSQSFTLTCDYVARPIGGINTKAAMLDILANCLEIASPQATFWGGGYQFMIHPHMYPFKRDDLSGSIMDKLYEGKIFGTNGALALGFKGLADFGKVDADGKVTEFSWANVTARLGDVISQTVGAIGSMLQSVSSALFGENSTLTGWLQKGTDMLSGLSEEEQQEAKNKALGKVNSLLGNVNKMWKDKVILETTMPSISGMKAILTGEPVGNWHMTVGNPLNPIMVIGNLICTKMDVQFNEELGPDDFPLEMKVTYTIEHAMARDKGGIQSMFNRGSGKIYRLPDYIKSTSDYETKVDNYTGRTSEAYMLPQWMSASQLMGMTGARGWLTYKITPGTQLSNSGNSDTTFLAKFTPVDPETAYQSVVNKPGFLANASNRSVFKANLFTRKRSNN